MATRTRNRSSNVKYGTLDWYGDGALVLSETQLLSYDSEVMDDTVTPNFHARINKGEIINNPCLYVRRQRESGGGYYNSTGPGTDYSTGGDGSHSHSRYLQYGIPFPGEKHFDSAKRLDAIAFAKSSAIASIEEPDWAAAEDLGELLSTLRLLKQPLGDLDGLTRKHQRDVLKNVNPSSYSPAFGGALVGASMWGLYQWAYRPLYNSIMDAMAILQDKSKNLGLSKRRTARGFQEFNDSGSSEFTVTMDFRETWNTTYQARAGILYQASSGLDTIRGRLGLRAREIPVTLWALKPLSFMIDRLWHVSNVIRGLTNLVLLPRNSILAGWVSETYTHEEIGRVTNYSHPTQTVTMSGDDIVNTTTVYRRNIWSPDVFDSINTPVMLGELTNSITDIIDLISIILLRFRGA